MISSPSSPSSSVTSSLSDETFQTFIELAKEQQVDASLVQRHRSLKSHKGSRNNLESARLGPLGSNSNDEDYYESLDEHIPPLSGRQEVAHVELRLGDIEKNTVERMQKRKNSRHPIASARSARESFLSLQSVLEEDTLEELLDGDTTLILCTGSSRCGDAAASASASIFVDERMRTASTSAMAGRSTARSAPSIST